MLLSSFCMSLSCLLRKKGSGDMARTLSKAVLCTFNSQNLFSFASSRGKFLVSFVIPDLSILFTVNHEKTLSRAPNHLLLLCLSQFNNKNRASRTYIYIQSLEAKIKGVSNRLHCCYRDLLCLKKHHYWFISGWAFVCHNLIRGDSNDASKY